MYYRRFSEQLNDCSTALGVGGYVRIMFRDISCELNIIQPHILKDHLERTGFDSIFVAWVSLRTYCQVGMVRYFGCFHHNVLASPNIVVD